MICVKRYLDMCSLVVYLFTLLLLTFLVYLDYVTQQRLYTE